MEIVWNEENQQYITIPDGNIATHKQIHDHYCYHLNIETTKYFADGKLLFEREENHIPHLY